MKLAAIDIGTNSIHMVVVKVTTRYSFDVIKQEKEMVKLGAGVFATNHLSDRAYRDGLETIRRYVSLADQLGVDEIITAATSAIREARNGGEFLDEVVAKTGLAPQVISGKEEARLIFLAVRNAIALQNENALVIDIGGGSTEAVVGNTTEVLFRSSMKLGVRRLLDMFENEGPIGREAQGVLESHIKYLARDVMEEAKACGFSQVIGTSGTIRTLGEAAHLQTGGNDLRTVNAEIVSLEDIEQLTTRLLEMPLKKRAEVEAINKRRADAIHLGGVLLVQLLRLADAKQITLCDASLREGLIIDYIQRYSQKELSFPLHEDLRHRSAAQLARKYNSDLEQKAHVAHLAVQLFDQLQKVHDLDDAERNLVEHAAMLYGIGQYIGFGRYHKNSRYIIKHSGLRGFTNEEVLLIGHIVRYHRKAKPKKKHKKFSRLTKEQQQTVRILAGILRIAIGLDNTKNQLVEAVTCQLSKNKISIHPVSNDRIELELWEARRNRELLQEVLGREIVIAPSS